MYKRDPMFDSIIQGLNDKAQYALSLHFQHQMIMEQFAKSKEMQKLKQEITNDVLKQVSVTIEDNVRKVLDDLFKEFNM